MGVKSGLLYKRAMRDRIMERKPRFQMRSGCRELTRKTQVSTGGHVTQYKPGSIVALTAKTKQILVQLLRQIEFAASLVIARLPKGHSKELRREIELRP